jgi:ferredoxin
MFFSTAACEKSIACSTCHVILEEKVYDTLEEPSDDENVSLLILSPHLNGTDAD